MKKMLDSKFLFILGLSILVLIGLGIGAFYLFDSSDNTFVKSGYVINPLSSKVEKYFFEGETSYRENLSSMIEFKDTENNDVTILKDSFLHYNDGGVSFLKNGAILDLNSINGKDAVAFYNITNESIIEKTTDSYLIRTSTNDIRLKNFIGRINDDKYIIVGNLELKIPGNNTTIKGDYFEIVYADNGVVNIENREIKYQVTAEGTYIYTGDILIDLGNKKIAKGNEDIMSITAITINGDENIEIIPKVKEEPTTTAAPNNAGNGTGNGTAENNGGNGQQTGTINKENNLAVNIKDATVSSTDITVKFDIENAVVTDKFSLRVTNLETGTVVRKLDSIESERPYTIPFLNPSTKYLFTIVNESDNGKYVQKMYETKPLGITIEKNYATESKLAYLITTAEETEVTSAKLILKKFDETTGITSNVKDENGNDRIIQIRNIAPGKEYPAEFTGLESDSIYTAVLTDFKVPPYDSLGSDDEDDGYKLSVTAMTLKKLPNFGNLTWSKDRTQSTFKLAITNIEDEDHAIRSYTYLVYNYDDPTKTTPAIPAIVKNNASPIEIPVDGTEGNHQEDHLEQDVRYYYKVVIEYFDNEKILEYITTNSDNNMRMETDPLVTIEPNDALTSYNRIYGTIYLTDKSCLLNSNDSEECSVTRNAYVQIINDPTGDSDNEATIVTTQNIKFMPGNDGRLQATIDIAGLEENTFYTVRVKANRTDMPNSGAVTIEYSGDSARGISTKSLSTFYVEWHDGDGSRENVVNVTAKFIADNIGDMSKEESAQAIKSVEISLYEGNLTKEAIEYGNISPIVPPVTKSYTTGTNIKEAFYDNSYPIGSGSIFDLNDTELAAKSTGGKIQQYYTIYINAYYDEAKTKRIELNNKTRPYRVDDALLREDIGNMAIEATKIYANESELYPNLHSDNTVIGYKVHTEWDMNKLLSAHFEPKKIRIYVIDKNNPNKEIKFYVEGEEGLQNEIYEDVGTSTFKDVRIYMDYGIETQDNIMRRGNDYYIGFEIQAISTTDTSGSARISHLPFNKEEDNEPKPNGKFFAVGDLKEYPQFKMYLQKSTATDVTYWYEIDDPDNYLYRESTEADYGVYYDVNATESMISITDDKADIDHNAFTDTFTIPNLNKGDYYAIYVKLKDKNGDVLKYPNITENTQTLFEGEYQATDYNFTFDIINNETIDNRVKIKILADEELLNRVVNYKVIFTTQNSNHEVDKTVSVALGKLSSCGDNSQTNRCIYVDYDFLRQAGMKSSSSSLKEIYTTIEIMYDNGLAGYAYNVGGSDENDPKYMIMQGNNTKAASGKYIVFTNGNKNEMTGKITYSIRIWNETDFNHKGYYRYTYKDDTTLQYTSYYAKSISPSGTKVMYDFPSFTLDNTEGRKVTIDGQNITLNPKMLVTASKDCDGNTFHFSSYTPTITRSNKVETINGEVFTITLTGASVNELCELSEGNNCINHGENGNYKMYIDVWDNLDDIGNKDKIVRPTIEVPIDASNPNKEYNLIEINGLKDTTKYYFRVYAWLNKNNTKHYTQLFDTTESEKGNGFKTIDYEINTQGSNLFKSITIASLLSDDDNAEYGDRKINTEIGINAYTNASIKPNYDINYIICDVTATIEECNPESNSNLKKLENTIPAAELKTSVTNSNKLPIGREFEHDKDYKVFAYAIYQYYEDYANTRSASTTPKYVLLGGGNRHINALKAPMFNNVEREAVLVGPNEYAIDITPHVVDESQVLTEGKYYIKLLSGDSVTGTMQIMEDGSYVSKGTGEEYLDNFFYIYDPNTQTQPVRFTGLNPNTAYSIIIYGEANVNNYDPNTTIEERTKTYQTYPQISVYSTDPSGVAFGEVSFNADENSIFLTFLGGSNISNVEKVEFTIGYWSNYIPSDEPNEQSFIDTTITFHDIWLTTEHGFGHNDNGDPVYTISPPGMDNTTEKGRGIPSFVKFYLKDRVDPITYYGAPVYKPEGN